MRARPTCPVTLRASDAMQEDEAGLGHQHQEGRGQYNDDEIRPVNLPPRRDQWSQARAAPPMTRPPVAGHGSQAWCCAPGVEDVGLGCTNDGASPARSPLSGPPATRQRPEAAVRLSWPSAVG